MIAVGADDLDGSPSITDDTVPAFSSRGNGIRNPDFVAPGVHVQSLRVPGSYIDSQYSATGAIGTRFFRGSGTSQAAAFVSGSLALMFQKYPNLTPDQAKNMLVTKTSKLPAADAQAQGSGLINMRNVAGAAPGTVSQTWTKSTGTGTLEGSRGAAHLTLDGVTLSGEQDINGAAFNAAMMATAEASNTSWSGGDWNGRSWTGAGWSGSSWAATAWSGRSWSGSTWSSRSWTVGTWSGSSWASTNWSDSSWTGATWSSRSWTGRSWTDNGWS